MTDLGGNTPPTDHKSLIEKAAERLSSNRGEGATSPRWHDSSDVEDRQHQGTHQASPAQRIAIDRTLLRKNRIISTDNLRNRTTEEFRLIKRGLLNRYTRNGADRQNLVLVTSSLSGEGKSFCALNIAMSIALEEDFRVLLVDCDITNPTIMRTLGIDAKLGLIDVLMNESMDLADVLIRTDIERLSILPPGTPHSRSTEFLSSKNMLNIVDQLAHRYDDRLVIFDAPPVLMTAETSVLAMHVGQIVFVVKAGTTSRNTAKDALDLIGDNPNINLVLNGTRGILGMHQFGQYYHQYKGRAEKSRRRFA